MQEEVTQRTVALCVEATRLSAGMLQQAMKKVLDEMQKGATGQPNGRDRLFLHGLTGSGKLLVLFQ